MNSVSPCVNFNKQHGQFNIQAKQFNEQHIQQQQCHPHHQLQKQQQHQLQPQLPMGIAPASPSAIENCFKSGLILRTASRVPTLTTTNAVCTHAPCKGLNAQKQKKTRRGLQKSKNKLSLVAIGSNAAGLKQKMYSLQSKIQQFQPACIFIQETKLYKKGQISLDGFQCFEHVRVNSKGGGLLLAIHKSFDPVLIYEGNDDVEILVVQGKIGKTDIRFLNAYGPQEDDDKEKIIGFY